MMFLAPARQKISKGYILRPAVAPGIVCRQVTASQQAVQFPRDAAVGTETLQERRNETGYGLEDVRDFFAPGRLAW